MLVELESRNKTIEKLKTLDKAHTLICIKNSTSQMEKKAAPYVNHHTGAP